MDLWDGAYDIVRRRMADNRQLLADPDPRIILRGLDDIPSRSDIDETQDAPESPGFETPTAAARPKWQRLSHAAMRDELYAAQQGVCAGCGRCLPVEFMELDHREPRADGGENYITNRVLLCVHCNRQKAHTLTISGLWRKNKRDGWLLDAAAARLANDRARARANRIATG